MPGRRSSKTGGRSLRDEGGYPRLKEEKRTSWAITDWEDLERSMEELGVWDENTYDDIDDVQTTFNKRDTASSDGKPSNKCNVQGVDNPRHGSLYELILKDDAPTISGCVSQKIRHLGLLHEKIISSDESRPEAHGL